MKTKRWFIALLFCSAEGLFAQEFRYIGDSPFGLQIIRPDSTRQALRTYFADYDGDADLDVIHTGIDYNDDVDPIKWVNIHYFLEVQENVGSRWYPQFGQRKEIYDSFPFPLGYFLPAVGDLNQDHQPDYLIFGNVDFAGRRTMTYCQKNPPGESPAFQVTLLPDMGLRYFLPESFFLPKWVDLDSDGDLDILMTGFDPPFSNLEQDPHPRIYYAKNTGTPSSPAFIGWFSDPYGLTPDPLNEFITGAGDIDQDGDMDLMGTTSTIPGDSLNYLYVHINTPGGNGKPSFGVPLKSPYGLPVGYGQKQFFFPEWVDIDSDGDLDLFVIRVLDEEWHYTYYENTQCALAIKSKSVSICFGEEYVLGDNVFSVEGDYLVYVPGPEGCDSLIELSLTVYEEIDASVSVAGNLLMANANGVTFQWINCATGLNIAGATSPSYTVQVTGNYAVLLTDVHGCSALSGCIHVVVSVTETPGAEKDILIFPNPTSGPLFICNNLSIPIERISLFTISGIKAADWIPREGLNIDLSGWANGVYILKIAGTDGEMLRKIIVMKE